MISRRFRSVATLLAILALVLAACGPQATPTPTDAPTDEPTPTEAAEEPTEEVVEATAEAVEPTEEVAEPTEEVVEATEEMVEPTEEMVEPTEEVAEPTEEATPTDAVVEPTEEVVEPTEEMVEPTEEVVEPTEEMVEPTEEVAEPTEEMVEATPEATEAPITTETFTDGTFSFNYPSNYTVEAGNSLYRVVNGDNVVVVVNNATYTTVLGGVSFDDNAAALNFYLDRTGYTVGEASGDGVAVELPRRNQSGVATLVDLGAGNSAVVISLSPDGLSDPAAAQILETVSIPSILGAALQTDGLSTFATAVVRAGLGSTVNGEGEYTVFAPSDDAFAAALEAMGITADDLLTSDTLESVLTYHVVEGLYNAADLTDGLELTTVNGEVLTVAISEEDGTVTINDVAGNAVGFVTTDVPASNGVIHVIDGVLSPIPAPEVEATPEATAEATAEATEAP
jgi:uncharacterized surface protein with fasciclin (FAS1) repeats